MNSRARLTAGHSFFGEILISGVGVIQRALTSSASALHALSTSPRNAIEVSQEIDAARVRA